MIERPGETGVRQEETAGSFGNHLFVCLFVLLFCCSFSSLPALPVLVLFLFFFFMSSPLPVLLLKSFSFSKMLNDVHEEDDDNIGIHIPHNHQPVPFHLTPSIFRAAI